METEFTHKDTGATIRMTPVANGGVVMLSTTLPDNIGGDVLTQYCSPTAASIKEGVTALVRRIAKRRQEFKTASEAIAEFVSEA